MPFIKQERRDIINTKIGGLLALDEIQPGDRCYVFYKRMVDKWKYNPRWTTAHEIYKEVIDLDKHDPEYFEDWIAENLAWQVFFHLHVIPYELEKEEQNGSI